MPEPIALTVPTFFQGKTRYSYEASERQPAHWSLVYRIYKPSFDIACTVLALPLIALVGVILLVVNPWLNPGPLFFKQERLGRHRKVFMMYKFRSMTVASDAERGADDALETHRITKLGAIMRKLRIDELPNFINVLRGEMSVIGPRPDARGHAEIYLKKIPHYAYRYMVKPGITGLAQIESGYAEGVEATVRKAHYDHLYVETSCGRLDVFIALRTLSVMVSGFGAK